MSAAECELKFAECVDSLFLFSVEFLAQFHPLFDGMEARVVWGRPICQARY